VQQQGVASSYKENRGIFVTYTLEKLLPEYPLGAGVGRWGMMRFYTVSPTDFTVPPYIHVEIQMTGWLLDGGVPMWILYGGAIFAALLNALKTMLRRDADPDLAYLAGLVLAQETVIFAMTWAGPAFNTQLGIQFWLLSTALFGAAQSKQAASVAEKPAESPLLAANLAR